MTKCIVGLFEPDIGEVYYNDRNFLKLKSKEKKEVRKEMGMLFQGSALFDSFSVEENVAFPLRMFTQMTNAEISERVNFCLNRVDIVNKNFCIPLSLVEECRKEWQLQELFLCSPNIYFVMNQIPG